MFGEMENSGQAERILGERYETKGVDHRNRKGNGEA